MADTVLLEREVINPHHQSRPDKLNALNDQVRDGAC
jgi:hypothetical protein